MLETLIHRAASRLSRLIQERRFGIHTEGEVFFQQVGITSALGCHHYLGTNYFRFWQLMRHVKVDPQTDVFLDFGSGMGRVVVLAATYPFRKVIGVEFVEHFHSIACENIRNAMPRLRCRDIELCNVDARTYRIPPEVTVIYLWNPFAGDVLAKVFSNIRDSLEESPRMMRILYATAPGADQHHITLDRLKSQLPWLPEPRRLRLGPDLNAAIYSLGEV